MRAAIYARYSSENQRRESIEDQISSCRKFAAANALVIVEEPDLCRPSGIRGP